MKSFITFGLAMALCLASVAPLKADPPSSGTAVGITFETVVEQIKSGVDQDILAQLISQSPTVFVLDAKQEQQLEKLGASSTLIAALKKKHLEKRSVGDITDFAVILDCSGSMLQRTKSGQQKMAVAKLVVNQLIDAVPEGLRLTFVIYGHDKKLRCKAVKVVRALSELDASGKTQLKQVVNSIQAQGATPIALALQTAGEQLKSAVGQCSIVLISDGKETCNGKPAEMAAVLAKHLNMPEGKGINVIGFDVKEDEKAALDEIAQAGKGGYYDARTAQDLKNVFVKVAPVEELEPEPEPQPAPRQSDHFFFDDFKGTSPQGHWEVKNVDRDSFAVEDDHLLLINGAAAEVSKGNIPNLFRLKKELPAGDWTMTMRAQVVAQTMEERIVLGLVDNEKNFILGQIAFAKYDFERYAGCRLEAVKCRNGQTNQFQRVAWRSKQRGAFSDQMRQFANPVLLRLQKQGRSYLVSMKLADDESPWVEMEKISVLRAKGQLALGLFQGKQNSGESALYVDWVKIEAAR